MKKMANERGEGRGGRGERDGREEKRRGKGKELKSEC